MEEIKQLIGWLLLWLIGMVIFPLLAVAIMGWIDVNKNTAMVVYVIVLILYWIITAIFLIV